MPVVGGVGGGMYGKNAIFVDATRFHNHGACVCSTLERIATKFDVNIIPVHPDGATSRWCAECGHRVCFWCGGTPPVVPRSLWDQEARQKMLESSDSAIETLVKYLDERDAVPPVSGVGEAWADFGH